MGVRAANQAVWRVSATGGSLPPCMPADANRPAEQCGLTQFCDRHIYLPGMTSASYPPVAEWDAVRDSLAGAHPFELPAFDEAAAADGAPESDASSDTRLVVTIELGRARLTPEEAATLREGSVASLDKLAADPVDILVGDRLVARGEVLVLEGNFCVRISEVLVHATRYSGADRDPAGLRD